MKSIRIATRNSPLALWQANYVKDCLLAEHNSLEVKIVGMTTQGDQLLDRSLVAEGGKGLFLKELEVSLLNDETDIAVHSMKDVPVNLPAGLEIPVVCGREDARDAFVSNNYQNLYALPKGARVGTSSQRRVAQLKNAFPALEYVELRGNVNTRLQKLDDGDYDAIILAAAGLIRLGFEDRISQYISQELCLPAVGQGIVGIECRSDDSITKSIIEPLHSLQSAVFLAAERAMNAALEGGCQVPIAGYAQIQNGKIRMRGLVGNTDGSEIISSESVGSDVSVEGAESLGQKIAEDLLKQGAGAILGDVVRSPVLIEKIDKPVVILTRQESFLGNTAAILRRLDYHPAHVPSLGVETDNDTALLAQFGSLEKFTDIIFISRNAVEVGMSMINTQGKIPDTVRVMAVGSETAKQLYQYGIDALFPDHGTGAEALLKVPQLTEMTGHKVMIVRGDKGLDWPAELIRERGAEVVEARCYRQLIPPQSESKMKELVTLADNIVGVFIHSSQSLHNLMKIVGVRAQVIKESTLVAGSEKIAETALDYDWKGEIRVAQSPSNKHMMIAFSEK